MTPEEAVKRFSEMGVTDSKNDEDLHIEADEILLKCLAGLGHENIVEAYQKARERIGFFYA